MRISRNKIALAFSCGLTLTHLISLEMNSYKRTFYQYDPSLVRCGLLPHSFLLSPLTNVVSNNPDDGEGGGGKGINLTTYIA